MTHYERLKRKRLGDILVDEGLVSKDTVISALHEQQVSRRLLSDILLQADELNEYNLARIIVEQQQLPFIDLANYTLHKDLIESFPSRLLGKHGVVPLDRFGQHVALACQEVPSQELVKELQPYAPGGIFFYVALASEVRRALQEHASVAGAQPSTPQTLGQPTAEEKEGWKSLFDAANEAVMSELKTADLVEDDAPRDDADD